MTQGSSSAFRRFGVLLVTAGLILFTFLMVFYSPFGFLLVPAILGGSVAALVMLRRHRFGSQPPTNLPPGLGNEVHPTDMINMARIQVSGIGGLGMVAMSAAVAFFVPPIRTAMVVAIIGGAIAALAVVLYRRRRGPIGSSDSGLPGARFMPIRPGDAPLSREDSARKDSAPIDRAVIAGAKPA
jgi:hypothetical protein